MRNVAIRVRERPRRKCVCAEAAVHESQRRLHALINQVREKLRELWSGQHALINERACRQRREICLLFLRKFVLNALACNKQQTVKRNSRLTIFRTDKHQREIRHHTTSAFAQACRIHRYFTPTENFKRFFANDVFDSCYCKRPVANVGWQERHSNAVLPFCWQRKTCNSRKKLVRNLNEHTSTVAGFDFCTGCSAVLHSTQRTNPHRHNVVRLSTLHVNDKRHATGVVFKAWVV